MSSPRQHGAVASWLGRVLILVILLGFYIPACAVPAVGDYTGLAALLIGWFPLFCIPWSANLLLVVGSIFLLCGRFKTAAWLGSFAALMALTTWGFGFHHLLMGYYLWQASMVILAAGAAVLALLGPGTQEPVSVAEGKAVSALVLASRARDRRRQ